MHQGNNNIFSFSDDEFERAQRNQQQINNRRRSEEKVRRVLQSTGFESAPAAHLVAIEEEEEDGIYGGAPAGAAAGATNNNINSSASMLSEMFNYAGPVGGDVLAAAAAAAAAAAHDQSTSSNPAVPAGAYHRLIQQTRPDFYGANNSRLQGLLMSSSAAANINNNINNWTGSVIEDAHAAAKQHHHHHHHQNHHGHGTNYVPAASADSSPSTAMQLFFMNPAPTSSTSSVAPAMHHQRSSASPDHPHDQPPMAPAASMLHHHHDQSQAFLGGAAAGATIFGGEGISTFGGGILRESQAGPALSLSSSTLQQLEMRKAADQELREARSVQGSAAAFLFYNSQQQQQQQAAHEQQLHLQHASSIQQPPPPPPPPSSCFQSQAGHQISQEGQYQQLHMSSSSSTYGSMSTANVLRNSKYARAAQELLEEFCSVSRGHVRGNTLTGIRNSSINPHLISHGGGVASSSAAAAAAAASSSSSKDIPPLSPADRFENQRKKSKLLSMLDEVERRYNHYCEQMQMVVNSFDSVMGFGAAMPYTALARKAMSRHFRCLKDAISAQLKQTCEVLGDNINDGGSGSGLTKGETPKLRLIDQNLRQQRAFHQMGVMDQEAWRPQRGLPDRSVTILRSWLFEHFLHPYPSDADKHLLARKTGLSRNQVSNWFINARVRLWKPMVEDMYQQEAKEELEDSQQLNEDHHETNTRRILLAAARTTQQQQPHSTSPESDAPAETVSIPYRSQLDHHYDRLRLAAAPITDHEPLPPPPPPPQPHDHDGDHTAAAASNSQLIIPLDDEMYRRAAAARTGDLSLTLGLRHAGGSNAPDTARFGL